MDDRYQVALSFATEEQALVEKVYHYLKAEGISVFFAPASECQVILSGRNQREVFYEIFGMKSEYVALFVSINYINKDVPMEEANIAFSKHGDNGSVIPIYLDGTELPKDMLNPKETNYFKSKDPVKIALHLATKIKTEKVSYKKNHEDAFNIEPPDSIMMVSGINGRNVFNINKLEGDINL